MHSSKLLMLFSGCGELTPFSPGEGGGEGWEGEEGAESVRTDFGHLKLFHMQA